MYNKTDEESLQMTSHIFYLLPLTSIRKEDVQLWPSIIPIPCSGLTKTIEQNNFQAQRRVLETTGGPG